MDLKNLAIGVSTFKSLIASNALYVDKTEFLYKLIKDKDPKRYFISRPRRFGKSLTCSTLSTIFEGDKKHFKGLWIEKSDYDWKKVPVIHLDFNEISHQSPEILEKALHNALNMHARKYKILLKQQEGLKEKLVEFVQLLSEKHGPVAIIIDEYDKALLDHIDKLEVTKQMQNVLRDFFGAFKGKGLDAHLRFLFVTGVSKFSKVSLFSDVNNLDDITMDERFDAIVGYTQKEVEANLHDHIQALADHKQISYTKIFEELKHWYNGFRFTASSTTVYNPVSLHSCLNKNDFRNYWFETGSPRFLFDILKKEPEVGMDFLKETTHLLDYSELSTFTPDVYYKKLCPLFLQTGYLTIKNYNTDTRVLELDYPNLEVRESMTKQIFEYLTHQPPHILSGMVDRMKKAILADDIEAFCQNISDYFVLIPHNIVKNRESVYQSLFYGALVLIGADAHTEVATNQGFIDAVLHGRKNDYLIEFKKDRSPDAALKQISDKKYFEMFKIKGKRPVVLVGMNFKKYRNTIRVSWKTATCKFKK